MVLKILLDVLNLPGHTTSRIYVTSLLKVAGSGRRRWRSCQTRAETDPELLGKFVKEVQCLFYLTSF